MHICPYTLQSFICPNEFSQNTAHDYILIQDTVGDQYEARHSLPWVVRYLLRLTLVFGGKEVERFRFCTIIIYL